MFHQKGNIMAKRGNSIKLKFMTEQQQFDLQQKNLEELFKEQRKTLKSIGLVKQRKKESKDLAEQKKKLDDYHQKHKQDELAKIDKLKTQLKDLKAELNIGAEEITDEIKELNRDFNNAKAPYQEKLKVLDRMISEKEFKM